MPDTPASPARSDPALPRRIANLCAAVLLAWPLLQAAGLDPRQTGHGDGLRVAASFLTGFLPPATDAPFLSLVASATLDTLAIATTGLLLALALALPLTALATRAVTLPGAPTHPLRSLARTTARLLLTVLRGIPELVWALLFVRIFGLGATAGVLALALTYGGMLGKVYAEILESGDARPAQALLEAGSGRGPALLYGLLPGCAGELLSYTVYRWECALRASVVMGFVGAGGLGQLIDQSMKMLNGGEVATLLLVFLLLVMAADVCSSALRAAIAPARPSLGRSALGWRGGALLLAIAAGCVLAFHQLDLGLAALFSASSLQELLTFAARFSTPRSDPAWLLQLARGAGETLAISAAGTLIAAATALLLAIPASGRWGKAARALTRFLLNLLRSVPELVWATLTVLAVGLGAGAGTLALALHTSGVLGRLFAEALENAPDTPRAALAESGAGAVAAFSYGTLPLLLPQLLAYTLYRWEINIRMAAVLGFVGAGGLGQQLYVALSLFHDAEAAAVILAMLLLAIAVDAFSARLRHR